MTPFLAEPSFPRILAWELAILFACFGWGWLLQRGLRLTGRAMGGAAMGGAYGLCVLMAFSGIANVTGTFGGAFVAGLAGGGCALAAIFLIRGAVRRMTRPDWKSSLPRGMGLAWRTACLALLAVLFLGQFAFRARSLEFSHVDDYQAYMVFPAKLLANGSLGPEPFSERRLVSSLGGKYALDAMVLWGNGFKGLWGTDNAVGLGLLLSALWGTGRCLGLPFLGASALCLWGLLIGPPAVNLTAVTLALPLILALQALFIGPAGTSPAAGYPDPRRSLGAGMLLAGLVLLKNSLLPIGGLLVAAHWARRALGARHVPDAKASALEALTVAGGFFACCLPWMASAWRDSGSPWFPLLGKGFSATAYPGGYLYSDHGLSARALARAFLDMLRTGLYAPLSLVILGTVAWAILAPSKPSKPTAPSPPPARGVRAERWAHALLPLAGLGATLVILAQQPSPQGDRFAFAGAMAAVFWGGASCAKRVRETWQADADSRDKAAVVRVMVLFLILASAIGAVACDLYENRRNGRPQLYLALLRDPLRAARNLARLAEGDLVPDSDVRRYAAAQSALPAGAKVLDRTLRPFLWDFSRNEILIADYPGAASPPPGMPIGQGPHALLAYLRSQGIGFAAFDRRSQAGLKEEVFRAHESDPGTGIWQRSQYRYARLVQRDLGGLDGLCPVAFADDEMVIFALGAIPDPAPPAS